jgi:Transposase IS66 family
MQITENLFVAYCHCAYNSFLKSKGEVGELVDYEVLQKQADARFKSRFEKYGERLFTFLDYDGVPWNNNNAENALKLVASRRRLFGTLVSEAGLKDYLVFLSIYQTLRRKGMSLLRFLLSGETDLENFVASYRRRS